MLRGFVARSSKRSGASAASWLFVVAFLALTGWTAFTVYERLAGAKQPTPTAAPDVNPRLEAFVTEGREQLTGGALDAAEEQFQKASGIADNDPRVVEGLAQVAAARAEGTWWRWVLGRYDPQERNELVRELERAVARARRALATAAGKGTHPGVQARLTQTGRRLDAMLVVALALNGDTEGANAALAARLAADPRRKLLRDFLAHLAAPPPPEGPPNDDQPDAGAEPTPTVEPSASRPTRPASGAASSDEDDSKYEFRGEPKTHGLPSTPGELQITVGKEKVKTVVVPSASPP